jgi:hypothetical protein
LNNLFFIYQGDDGLDLENLGNGALMTWAIITPILFAAYLIDGIDYIQNLFLESVRFFLNSFIHEISRHDVVFYRVGTFNGTFNTMLFGAFPPSSQS